MTEVAIYTAAYCPYCVRAKRLLAQKGVSYREIDVTTDDALREKMIAASGRRTVPQIFIDGRPIGGYDELAALEQSGELDAMLSARSDPD
jgi:glutaredoxin 3